MADSDMSQTGLHLTFALLGSSFQPDTGYAPTSNKHCHATSLHTGDAIGAGFVRVQPKFTTISKVITKNEISSEWVFQSDWVFRALGLDLELHHAWLGISGHDVN